MLDAGRRELRSELQSTLTDRLGQLPQRAEVASIVTEVQDLDRRFQQVSERLNEWTVYRKLQEHIEMGAEGQEDDEHGPLQRNPFSFLHLLHPYKSTPLTWTIANFSTFIRLAKKNAYRR